MALVTPRWSAAGIISCPAWLLATGLVLALVAGCTPSKPDTLRFGLSDAPANLDPRYATDAVSARINRLLYRRLVDFDSKTRPVPSLATWQQLGPQHYRFQLGSEGRRFHDGSRLTAEDVRATYWSILHDDPVSPHRSTLQVIKDIKTIGEDTVDFFLTHPDPLFPAYLAVGIIPASALADGHTFQKRPLGSGNFRFLGWPQPERLQLVRQTDGQLFEFLRVADPTVRVLKLLRGEIDMLQNDLPAELIVYLQQQENIKVRRADGSNFTYLGFNLEDPVTGQLAVRKAIAYGIDRDSLIKYVLGGAARTAGALFPPEHWVGHPNLTGYPYDPARSRKILGNLDQDNTSLEISYKTSQDPVRVRLATILQYQLKQVGINIKLQSYDWGTFYGDIKSGHFQMYSLAWVGVKTPDIFHYIFHSTSVPPTGANRGRFSDAKVDDLLMAARTSNNLEEHVQLFHRLQQTLFDLLPYIPLWYEGHVFASNSEINGYQLASDGNYDGLLAVHRARQVSVQ